MIKLGVAGVCGKMGKRIIELASLDRDFEVNFALERKGIPQIGKELGKIKISSNPDGLFLVDVFIDFTVADASEANLDYVARHKKALVLGTTGFNEKQIEKVKEVSKIVPIVFSPNMSVGVNVLFSILPKIASALGKDYEVEIIEAHHKNKKDSPSGTAKRMGQVLADTTNKQIPIHAVRLGDIIGDHTVIFCGNSERIEIKHQAHSRDLFVLGALKAAKWIHGKPAGLYTMEEVLASS
ncbi:MAG: 4-hydroxy-tetrahydrodipicolinate reductase [Candidatus Omnitrophota bacterium]|jgi:4-hydroxy-tetrahydrodipicolinate reductase|nr:MAG: 4-hydroxy-tetrahydrodipicolinate reductase [Candidatus Omnitrophota bacterium]